MHVHQLAKKLEVGADTVRFYTRIGFLHPIKNPSNGYREYSEEDRRRLAFILSARQLGFSIEDLHQMFDDKLLDDQHSLQLKRLIDERLRQVKPRLDGALQLYDRLQTALMQWRQIDNQHQHSHEHQVSDQTDTQHPTARKIVDEIVNAE